MGQSEDQSGLGARRLTEANLPTLARDVAVPTYDRKLLKQAIVHIGVGGFHRAHQAVYLDDLAERRITNDWGLCGVGLLPQDKRMAEALIPQQGLYTVVQRSAEQDQARVVGTITDYLFAPDDPARVLRQLTDATTRIVSLTITEGGYNFDQTTGEFEAENPAVQYDVRNPSHPTTVFGYICEALDRRRRAGIAPFTVLSCDNVQGNGTMARKMMLSFAGLRDNDLSRWIAANVAFPNSMVDRITPQTTDSDREMVARVFGIDDAWPVITEPFRQWIIDDEFGDGGRPPLQDVGVQFTTDVHPYETMKIRLLNGSHVAMGYLGYLAGYRYIHDVMNDALFRAYIIRLMDTEVTALLPPVPGIDLAEYKHTLIERFANPKIGDQVARICLDGSAKMPKFLLPSVHEALAQNRPYRLLVLAVAGWLRYLTGIDEQGAPIAIQDAMADTLRGLARQGREDPRPLLGVRSLFGSLADNETFVTALAAALHELYERGARATVATYLGNVPA